MITVNYNELTKKFNVTLNESGNGNNLLKVIEKNNYVLFFSGDRLVQYVISNYGIQKNSFKYHKKLHKFLGKDILKFIK